MGVSASFLLFFIFFFSSRVVAEKAASILVTPYQIIKVLAYADTSVMFAERWSAYSSWHEAWVRTLHTYDAKKNGGAHCQVIDQFLRGLYIVPSSDSIIFCPSATQVACQGREVEQLISYWARVGNCDFEKFYSSYFCLLSDLLVHEIYCASSDLEKISDRYHVMIERVQERYDMLVFTLSFLKNSFYYHRYVKQVKRYAELIALL